MSAVQSKLSPISTTCIEYVHPWTDSCTIATAGLLLQSAQESFRIYAAVYTLGLLMRFKWPTVNELKRTFFGIIQSTGFLTTSAFTYCLFLCILRKVFGSFNFYTVSYVPAFMSSVCALLIERPSRHNLLCLYVSNVATETLFNMACSRNICRPIPHGQVLIFGASISALLYYFRKGSHQYPPTVLPSNSLSNNSVVTKAINKDSIFDIIRFVVGRHEEYAHTLHFQPQVFNRRRERIVAPANNLPSSSDIRDSGNQQPVNVYTVISYLVRCYTKLLTYIKTMRRHRSCPHSNSSCVYYVVHGGLKMFSVGVGVQVTLNILLQLKSIMRDPLKQLRKICSSKDSLKLGVFLCGFAAIFRLASCSLRHLSDKDSPSFAIPAALLASTAFASYADTTVALYVMWKALQISYNMGTEAGYLPKIPYFTFFLYCASTATLFHAATLEPTNLRSSYWKFLHSLSGGRVAGMDRKSLDVYGLDTSRQLAEVLLKTKTSRNINFVL